MSKTLGFNLVLVIATCGVAIASLVFSIMIYNKVGEPTLVPTSAPIVDPNAPPPRSNTPGCKVSGQVSTDKNYKSAADELLRGLNRGIDPCTDFYTYSCKAFLDDKNTPSSPSGESQMKINLQIADFLDDLNVKKADDYEKIARNAYQLCSDSMTEELSIEMLTGRLDEVQTDLLDFVQFPLFGFPMKDDSRDALFTKIGRTERQFLTSILMGSGASVDYKVNGMTAVYVDQAGLSYPRDYYVKNQFLNEMQDYANDIAELLKEYRTYVKKVVKCDNFDNSDDCITEFAQWVVNFEVQIALASWDDSEMRNVKQQYNPFTLTSLPKFFKHLPIDKYVMALTDGMRPDPFKNRIIIGQPPYFTWLDALLDSDAVTNEQLTNYLATMFLLDTADYHYLGSFGRAKRRAHDGPGAPLRGLDARRPSGQRKGRGARKLTYNPMFAAQVDTPDSVRHYCVEMLLVYLPYAPGYIYVKNLRDDKYAVKEDVKNMTQRIVDSFSDMIDSLDWMDSDGKKAAHKKSENLLQNIGWPDWYEPFDGTSDAAVNDYHADYMGIIDSTTYWQASKIMKGGLETREFWRMLSQKGDDEIRPNFLQSPAMVNAWYQPERNSITFPLANMAPPYYSLNYPQAYNYAGQGGTAGHELTHGYDDEGVQFDENGKLANCAFTHCSILDDDSRQGFSDMAQCVVQQFNLQCCPVKTGNVRCANGANTQGENIADIGGQQAAYRAYQAYIQDPIYGRNGDPEDLLPGLEDLTPNQVFWLSYGFSWCSKKSEKSLVSQLETDPHAPSICRVNQVMQDIPQFGRDFKCKRGNVLYPQDDDRCKVWVGF
ncbi:hypothetical protein PRIPAC_70302 [Pristionchus pacificus]|uniref:Nep-22 n=1 Tax=Pristionchus pacificus TaxID=54126 RepID=A0A2A6BFU5_PRIPA|nr:hypothetical protein PRIPAC_70302 [Pristionchus pacificus]|eukprot:PDM64752.1 nep-22 [Pristionchus pacificus]